MFNDDIWSVAVIVLSVLTGMSHMMVMLLSLLCITVSGSCSYHLYICSNGDMLQHYCAWRCTLFWLKPHIQIQYGPLTLHVANTFCICSPLAGYILLSGGFWCLLCLFGVYFSSPNSIPISSLNCFTIFSSPTCSCSFLLYNFRLFI